MKTVYVFPNGFQKEATATYGWLRHYNLNPAWGTERVPGQLAIDLPEADVECLLLMAKADPARFGNAVEVKICGIDGQTAGAGRELARALRAELEDILDEKYEGHLWTYHDVAARDLELLQVLDDLKEAP